MIQLMFEYGIEKVLLIIRGNEVRFGNTAFGAQTATIDGLKLSYEGVCREFPDLEVAKDWKHQAIVRFKEKIKSFKTEEEISEYLKNDLKKFGYKLKGIQKQGFRPQKINNGK